MSKRTYGLPGNGYITIETGNEGPAHDPYGFTRVTIKRAGQRAITLHDGLGVWSNVEGHKSPTGRTAGWHHQRFCKYSGGFTVRRIEEFCERYERRKEKRFTRETGMDYADVARAERSMGWDPNP